MKRIGWLVGIASTLLFSSYAQAQINTAAPAGYAHVWSIPGVVNNLGVGTYFACTNAGANSATIGVQVFGPAGGASINNFNLTAISVASGATVLFGTSSAIGLSVDGNLAVGAVTKGSARIVATTSRGILCSAFLADLGSAPPRLYD